MISRKVMPNDQISWLDTKRYRLIGTVHLLAEALYDKFGSRIEFGTDKYIGWLELRTLHNA